jgi:hypothetical protein
LNGPNNDDGIIKKEVHEVVRRCSEVIEVYIPKRFEYPTQPKPEEDDETNSDLIS